jgi:ferredoxin-type protein NapH
MTRWLVPFARRCIQLVGLSVLVLLPLIALYTHFHSAHAIHDLDQRDWRHVAVQGIDQVVNRSVERRILLEKTQGTIWSARVFGLSLSDPLAGAEAIISSRSLYEPMLWSLLIPVIITVLLGRVFCGWICPMNTLLEVVDYCRRWLRFAEIPERDVRFSRHNKYLLLAVVLGLVGFTSVPFIALVYPPAVMSREIHRFVFSSTVGIGTYLILAICAIELFISKRWWCRTMCPGGALYSLLGRFRVVRVERDQSKCIQCGACVRVCQFDLRPMLVQITGMECTNCGSCITSCHDDALHLRLMLPHQELRKDARHAVDEGGDKQSTLPILGLFMVLSFIPSASNAHHILGLPHYSYKDNYPQAPTLEYPATTGPYDVLMTSFPGHAVPLERTTIAFYIKDRNTGLPYHLPVSLRILQTATFGANEIIMEPTIHEPTTNQHKYFVTFPADGEFIVELTLEVEGKPEVIPFLMIAGQPSAAKSIVFAVAVGMSIFLIVVRAIHIKRQRSSRHTTRSQHTYLAAVEAHGP